VETTWGIWTPTRCNEEPLPHHWSQNFHHHPAVTGPTPCSVSGDQMPSSKKQSPPLSARVVSAEVS